MPPDRVDLLVVGGGIGGLALAVALRGRGCRIEILERDQSPRLSRRGDLLQPNGLAVLERLGVLEAMRKPAVTVTTWHYYGRHGARLTSRDYRILNTPGFNAPALTHPHPHPYALSILPHLTRQVLLDVATQDPGVRVRPGCEVTGLLHDGTRLIGVRVNEGEASREVEARVIVGADGARSKIREAMGIRARIRRYREAYLTTVVPRPPGLEAEGRLYFGRRTYLGMVPVSPDDLYIFFYIDPSSYSTVRGRGLEALKAEIVSAAPEILKADGLSRLTSWDDLLYWPCLSVRCDRWVGDSGALIGDAAHAMSPHVAQGTNQALADAWALGEVIGRCMEHGDFSAAALRPYEEARRPAVEFLQRLAEEYALFFPPRSGLLGRLRDWALERSNLNPRLQHKDVATVAGLSTEGYTLYDRLCVLGWPDPWAHEP